MSEALFNEVGSLILDGRIDAIVGNTIAQNCFGNNFATTIGRGTQFNIDWIKFLSKIGGPKINIHDVSSMLRPLLGEQISIDNKKASDEDMRTGFYEQTAGDTFTLQSHGTMWDFTRGVEKTEFAIDPTYNQTIEGYKEGEELKWPIIFLTLFNLCTCVALQVWTICSNITSENDPDSQKAEKYLEILTILQLVIYGIVPIFNQSYARLIQTLEVTYYLAYKKLGEEEIAKTNAEQLIATVKTNLKIAKELKDQMGLTQGVLKNMTTAFSDNTYNWQQLQESMKKYTTAYKEWTKLTYGFRGPKPQVVDYLENINNIETKPLTP